MGVTGGGGLGGGSLEGGGGAATPVKTRELTVHQYDGGLAEGVTVLAHDASGELVDRQLSSAQGIAEVVVPDDGMLTVVYETIQIEPDGQGNSTTEVMNRRLRTLFPVGGAETLSTTLSEPRVIERSAPLTLEITANIPEAASILVTSSCGPMSTKIPAVGLSTVEVRGCAGASDVDVALKPVDSFLELVNGLEYLEDLPITAGTTSISIATAELQTPMPDFVFTPSDPGDDYHVVLAGKDPSGWTVCYAHPFRLGNGSLRWDVPPCDEASHWLMQEVVNESSRLRRVQNLPAGSTWTPVPLVAPDELSSEPDSTPARPSLRWSWDGDPSPETHALYLARGNIGSGWRWDAWLPATALSFRWPALPADVADAYALEGLVYNAMHAVRALDGSAQHGRFWSQPDVERELSAQTYTP